MRPIQKLDQLPQRMPEAGRIRFGVKGPKGEPRSITTFRFTSPREDAIRDIAEVYGGEPQPWADKKHEGEWELITPAKEIRVILPPDPLGGTPVYELWKAGGVQRRCDGEIALVPQKTPDGVEMAEVGCLCDANQKLECKPKTRLSVILPDIRFSGTWRLESGGWNAAQELPGMVATIQALQDRGFVVAKLGLKRESKAVGGQTRNWVSPYLALDASPEQLVAGEASLRGIPRVSEPLAITSTSRNEPVEEAEPPPPDDFDDVVDAEIVEMEPEGRAKRQAKMFALLKECSIDSNDRAGFALRVSEGRTRKTSELNLDELNRVLDVLELIRTGEAAYNGLNENGYAMVSRP